MLQQDFLEWAKREVHSYAMQHRQSALSGNDIPLTVDDIFVVWYCKTLQNHKALLGSSQVSGAYFEFTYNGDKDEAYLDVYGKHENVVVKP